jgi:hypothetical protein
MVLHSSFCKTFIAAAVLCLWLGGCASPGSAGSDGKPAFRAPDMTVGAAKDSIILGKSTKADVLAALGPATVITFDSAYEVWVYRPPAPRGMSRSELVVLFTPSGVASKVRVRPSYPAT